MFDCISVFIFGLRVVAFMVWNLSRDGEVKAEASWNLEVDIQIQSDEMKAKFGVRLGGEGKTINLVLLTHMESHF